jgi:DNA-binding transcriptional LysR family regulator
MDIRDLRTFVVVAELASFSRAAEQLHLAQPAVSQHVKRLERDLGAAVLRRSTRRVELTAVGQQLLRRARSILAEVEHAEQDVRLLESGRAGRVSVGFVGTATYDLLPRVARRVRQQLPDVALELHGEKSSALRWSRRCSRAGSTSQWCATPGPTRRWRSSLCGRSRWSPCCPRTTRPARGTPSRSPTSATAPSSLIPPATGR